MRAENVAQAARVRVRLLAHTLLPSAKLLGIVSSMNLFPPYIRRLLHVTVKKYLRYGHLWLSIIITKPTGCISLASQCAGSLIDYGGCACCKHLFAVARALDS